MDWEEWEDIVSAINADDEQDEEETVQTSTTKHVSHYSPAKSDMPRASSSGVCASSFEYEASILFACISY